MCQTLLWALGTKQWTKLVSGNSHAIGEEKSQTVCQRWVLRRKAVMGKESAGVGRKHFIYSYYSYTLVNTGDMFWEMCCVHVHRVHVCKPRKDSLLHTEAKQSGLLLLGDQPLQHVTVQNNTSLHQAREKMTQPRDAINTGWIKLLPPSHKKHLFYK